MNKHRIFQAVLNSSRSKIRRIPNRKFSSQSAVNKFSSERSHSTVLHKSSIGTLIKDRFKVKTLSNYQTSNIDSEKDKLQKFTSEKKRVSKHRSEKPEISENKSSLLPKTQTANNDSEEDLEGIQLNP